MTDAAHSRSPDPNLLWLDWKSVDWRSLDPLTAIGEAWARMKAFINFVMNMDARAWRTVLVSFVLFGGVGLVFVFGAQLLHINGEQAMEQWMGSAQGVWALPMAVGAFALLAFLGVPQIVLIAAAVVAFGPWTGMLYSWIGTMVSSMVGFWLGRLFGGRLLRDIAGERVQRFMALIGANGFMASLIVRLVPSAPFIVVNMAAGVSPMKQRDFFGGTALGILPKIVLTALAGHSAVKGMHGGGWTSYATIAIAAVAWIWVGWYARKWLKSREEATSASPPDVPEIRAD